MAKEVVLTYGDDSFFVDELQEAHPNGIREVRLKPGSEKVVSEHGTNMVLFDVMLTPYASVRKEGKKTIRSGRLPEIIARGWILGPPHEFANKDPEHVRVKDFKLRLAGKTSIEYHIKWVYYDDRLTKAIDNKAKLLEAKKVWTRKTGRDVEGGPFRSIAHMSGILPHVRGTYIGSRRTRRKRACKIH
jgi:hypothetical protein